MAINNLTETYLNSIIFSDEPGDIQDVLPLIDSPFVNRKRSDALSMLFHRFYENTDIPLGIPIFSFFSYLSAFCLLNKATMKIPKTRKNTELDTWVMLLAPSGSSKSLSNDLIGNLIPLDLNGNKVIEPNIAKPNGPVGMIKQLAAIPEKRGFWIEDEAAQMFKGIEQVVGPMSEMRDYLLKLKEGQKIERLTSKEHIEIKDFRMTQLFINTIDSMANTLTEQSMHDGLFRRYQVAVATKDLERPMENHALYNLSNVIDDTVEEAFDALFSQNIFENIYTFEEGCEGVYSLCFKRFWEKQYKKFMSNDESKYRTYMMESWKYAVFNHILHKRAGTVISCEDLQYGLKVSMYLLNSLQHFVKFRAKSLEIKIPAKKDRIEQIMDFIRSMENTKDFGCRVVQRKFNIKKDELILILHSIKVHQPKFKTSLFSILDK
jgi:hypothetical protein